jgi:hypothetical protein
MCDVLLPPGVNPTAVKYIYIYIYKAVCNKTQRKTKNEMAG